MSDFKSHLPVQTHPDGASFTPSSDYTVGVGGYESISGTILNAAVTPNREWMVANATLESIVYDEDSASANENPGVSILSVRQDTIATDTTTDGDYQFIKSDAQGRIYVRVGAEYLEDSAHSSGDLGQFVLAVRNDTRGSLVDTDGDYSPFALNGQGDLYVIDTAGNLILTDIKTAVEILDNIVYAEDSPHVNADPGAFVLGVRDDGVEASVVYDTVTFTADFPGLDGNSIALVFDNVDDIDTVVNAWNAANPTNTVSFSGQAGTYVPAAGTTTLANGAIHTVMTSADGDYSALSVDKYGRLNVVADLDVNFDYVYEEDSAHSSGDLGAYVLAVRSDSRPTNANTNADGDYASFFINVNGELYVHDTDALVKLTEIDTVLDNIYLDTTTIAGDTTSIDATLIALSHLEDTAHVSGQAGLMPLGVRQDVVAPLAADGDYIPFSMDRNGSLRVTVTDPNASATEVDDYNTTVAVATGATVNHDYTVTALKTLLMRQAWATASGRIKVELIIDPGGTPLTKFVGFNSTANPNIEIPIYDLIEVAAGTVVRIAITNLDNRPQDVYSTLLGNEI